MTVGRDSVPIDVGAGTLYIAPIGTAEPASLTAAWDVGFVDLGYTEKGHMFTVGMTVNAVEVAEEYYPVGYSVLTKTGTVAFSLSQMTAKNLQVANAGGTITVGATDVQFEPPLAGTESRYMLAWEATDHSERYLWRRCFQTGPSATNRDKALPQALIPVSFDLEKPTGKVPWKWWGTLARSGQ